MYLCIKEFLIYIIHFDCVHSSNLKFKLIIALYIL